MREIEQNESATTPALQYLCSSRERRQGQLGQCRPQSAGQPAANRYRVTELGAVGRAYDINEARQVVGDNDTRGFRWTSKDGLQNLPHLPDACFAKRVRVARV
jgi:hypothetical protein